MRNFLVLALGLVLSGTLGCSNLGSGGSAGEGSITSTSFGTTKDGQAVKLYTLTNQHGMKARITNYGATLVELWVPDKSGKLADVVLGFDNVTPYEAHFTAGDPFLGATIGRYGNRIAKGKFSIDGKEYTLATNNGPNSLHGGDNAMYKKVWKAVSRMTPQGPALVLTYRSPDMEEGFPGNMDVTVTYTLTNDNGLKIDYQATTDKPTVANLTNHSYFNLAGAGNGNVLDHQIRINADNYTPVDANLIPTGKIEPVAGTPLDLREPVAIGSRIDKFGDIGGFDHNYVLNVAAPGTMTLAVRVTEPKSGRVMEVLTTEPGIQFYTGMNQEGIKGLNGPYVKFGGFCLETQHYPDSPNQPTFPSTILRPGQVYSTQTIYKFSNN
jgi:aldose 1-epimerase